MLGCLTEQADFDQLIEFDRVLCSNDDAADSIESFSCEILKKNEAYLFMCFKK